MEMCSNTYKFNIKQIVTVVKQQIICPFIVYLS